MTLEERIARHTYRDSSGCLIWTAAVGGRQGGDTGRPVIRIAGQTWYVARVMLERKLGRPLREDMVAAHTCDNGRCVEGEHLEEQTYSANLRAAWCRKRRKYCRPKKVDHFQLIAI
jgi:hypothetical protein